MTDSSPDADDLRAVARAIRADRTHGASWLARLAVRSLAEAAVALATQSDLPQAGVRWVAGARALAHARPSMAVLATAVARVYVAGWSELTDDATRMEQPAAMVANALGKSAAEARRLLTTWDASPGEIAAHANPLLHGTVLTHSRSGTVEQVLAQLTAAPSTAIERVIVTESRPGDEGVALARSLLARGVAVTLIPDAAIGLAASQAQCAVVGADSIRADGSVVNKVGTYPLALVARAAHVPLYVLSESLKIAPATWPLILEELDPTEFTSHVPPGFAAPTTGFDLTPAPLVHAFLSEHGRLTRARIRLLAAAAARDLAALDAKQ